MGRLLGALGRLLAVLGAFKIELFSSMGPRWAPRGLLDRFWIDFKRFGGRFGRVWGRNLEGFGSFWGGGGQILEMLGMIWLCWGRFSNWTPALIRKASQLEMSAL